jgi:hypothetical protein
MTNIEKLDAIRDISQPLYDALVKGAKITIIERRGGNLEAAIGLDEVADVACEWLAKNLPHIAKARALNAKA